MMPFEASIHWFDFFEIGKLYIEDIKIDNISIFIKVNDDIILNIRINTFLF